VLAGGADAPHALQGHPPPAAGLGGPVIPRQLQHALRRRGRRQRHHPDHLAERQPREQPQRPPLRRRGRRRRGVPLPGAGPPLPGPDGAHAGLGPHGGDANPPALHPRQRVPDPAGLRRLPGPLPRRPGAGADPSRPAPPPPAAPQEPLAEQRQRLHQHGPRQRRAVHRGLQPRRQHAAALPLRRAWQQRRADPGVRTGVPEGGGATGPRVAQGAARRRLRRAHVQRLGDHRGPVGGRRGRSLSFRPRRRSLASEPGARSRGSAPGEPTEPEPERDECAGDAQLYPQLSDFFVMPFIVLKACRVLVVITSRVNTVHIRPGRTNTKIYIQEELFLLFRNSFFFFK